MNDADDLGVLAGAPVAEYTARLECVRQLRKSGWRGFSLRLVDQSGMPCDPPVVTGIHSVGGKDGVKPWLDIVYREPVIFPRSQGGPTPSWEPDQHPLSLPLFRLLGRLIPPGGHLMVSYEDEDPVHMETMLGLQKRIPPAATPLGSVLFLAGFPLIKNWYLSEGGYEGPRKLWAERAPDPPTARKWAARTLEELGRFLETSRELDQEPIRKNASFRALRLLHHKGFERARTK